MSKKDAALGIVCAVILLVVAIIVVNMLNTLQAARPALPSVEMLMETTAAAEPEAEKTYYLKTGKMSLLPYMADAFNQKVVAILKPQHCQVQSIGNDYG